MQYDGQQQRQHRAPRLLPPLTAPRMWVYLLTAADSSPRERRALQRPATHQAPAIQGAVPGRSRRRGQRCRGPRRRASRRRGRRRRRRRAQLRAERRSSKLQGRAACSPSSARARRSVESSCRPICACVFSRRAEAASDVRHPGLHAGRRDYSHLWDSQVEMWLRGGSGLCLWEANGKRHLGASVTTHVRQHRYVRGDRSRTSNESVGCGAAVLYCSSYICYVRRANGSKHRRVDVVSAGGSVPRPFSVDSCTRTAHFRDGRRSAFCWVISSSDTRWVSGGRLTRCSAPPL